MQSGEGSVLLVGVDEEMLPPVDLGKSPSVKSDGPRVFCVLAKALSGRRVRLLVERPVLHWYVPLEGFFLCEVGFYPVNLTESVDGRGDELPEVSVSSCNGNALFELVHGVMNISAVRDNGFLPSEGEGVGQSHDLPSLCCLVFTKDGTKHSAAVAGNQPPAGSWAPWGVTAAAICRNEGMLLSVLWEVKDGGLEHLGADRRLAVPRGDVT